MRWHPPEVMNALCGGRVLTNDDGRLRHADAAYEIAQQCADDLKVKIPMGIYGQKVYVSLRDEDINVWHPVAAKHLGGDDIFQVDPNARVPEDEKDFPVASTARVPMGGSAARRVRSKWNHG